jgi:hypothetical protein
MGKMGGKEEGSDQTEGKGEAGEEADLYSGSATK